MTEVRTSRSNSSVSGVSIYYTNKLTRMANCDGNMDTCDVKITDPEAEGRECLEECKQEAKECKQEDDLTLQKDGKRSVAADLTHNFISVRTLPSNRLNNPGVVDQLTPVTISTSYTQNTLITVESLEDLGHI
jgi:hypothetical protein